MKPLPLLQTFLLSLLFHQAYAQTTASVSVGSYAPWVSERSCGQLCVWIDSGHIGAAHADIVMFLDCSFPYLNLCLCNSDYGTSITSFLSSCVSSRCSTASQNAPPEITTAVEVYNGYCAQAVGVTFPSVASTLAVTTGVGSFSSSSRTSGTLPLQTGTSASGRSSTSETTSTQTSTDNGVSTPSSSSTSSGRLSESDKIALGVGLGMGLPSITIAVATFWSMRRRRQHAAAVE